MTQILKLELPFTDSFVQALAVIPEEPQSNSLAVFSHGYTAHKGSVLSWALKLAEHSMPAIVFDLPGHYLGSFHEANSFEDFKLYSSDLFITAAKELILKTNKIPNNIILGGHSLGGLLSIKALEHQYFLQYKNSRAITVGVGLPKISKDHVLQGSFFESMLRQRSQLVSQAINPKVIFNWIRDEKAGIKTSHKKIHLITGDDDFIAPPANLENFKAVLENNKNDVQITIKKKLPHHQPELASTLIKKIIEDQGFL